MKRILSLVILTIIAVQVWGQTDKSYDSVIFLNGEEHVGNVTEILDDAIKFVYKNETLTYTFKKADIEKIVFASGRTEIINKVEDLQPETNTPGSGMGSHSNKLAILPFKYLINKSPAGDDMYYKVQSECFSFLNGHTGLIEIQDPVTTNALLTKAGVTFDNIRGFTMSDICNILDVELVISGVINQDQTSSTNYQSTSEQDKNRSNRILKLGSSVSTNVQNFQTTMTMNMYNDKNQAIFSKEHQAFFDTNNAYIFTLQYLLKRTPVYKK